MRRASTCDRRRAEWNADVLLNFRLWHSLDLAGWELENGLSPLTGRVHLPVAPATAARFFRIEVVLPGP